MTYQTNLHYPFASTCHSMMILLHSISHSYLIMKHHEPHLNQTYSSLHLNLPPYLHPIHHLIMTHHIMNQMINSFPPTHPLPPTPSVHLITLFPLFSCSFLTIHSTSHSKMNKPTHLLSIQNTTYPLNSSQ